MIEQKQQFLHKPDEGSIGDCFRTCIACVLDLPRDDVPHVYKEVWVDKNTVVSTEAQAMMNAWLLEHCNLRFVEIPLQCDEEQLRTYIAHYFKGVHVIIGCNSKNGGHSVVMKEYDYFWDPSIDNSGCVGPMEDGYYWLGIFVKPM